MKARPALEVEARLRRRARRDPLLAEVARSAAKLDVDVWLVGGAVRDAALGHDATDLDLAAGTRAAVLAKALAGAWRRRMFRFRKRGVTTWRTSVDGRAVDLVDAGSRGIVRDLARRDFTVNAVAFDLRTGELLDPLRGLADLRRRVLRLPRPGVVREDPLRALRAARFLASLPGFRLDRPARAAVRRAAPALARVSKERIFDELDRILTSADPARGLAVMDELALTSRALPELGPMATCVAGAGRPDVLQHTRMALALAASPARLPGRAALRREDAARVLRWAILLHDVAKPETLSTANDGRPTFHGHEVLGARRAEQILKRLRAPGDLRRRVGRLVLFHLRPHHLSDAGAPPRGIRRLVRDAGDDLPLLVLHAACDAKASGSPDAAARWRRLRRVLVELLETHRRWREAPLAALVNGTDVMRILGIPPGPEVGAVLREIRELQEEGRLADRESALDLLRARR